MLRMDGSTDEGRAYGPFPVAPSHPVQSASARLHPCAFGMGGASLRARGGVGIRFVEGGDVGTQPMSGRSRVTWRLSGKGTHGQKTKENQKEFSINRRTTVSPKIAGATSE